VVDASEANLKADRATGFSFVNATEPALHAALHRAQRLHADPPRWQQVMRRAMAQDFSWDEAAARYLDCSAVSFGGWPASRGRTAVSGTPAAG